MPVLTTDSTENFILRTNCWGYCNNVPYLVVIIRIVWPHKISGQLYHYLL